MRQTRTLPKIIFFFFCYNQKANRIRVGRLRRKQTRCVMMSSKYFPSLSVIDFKHPNPDSTNSPLRYYSDSWKSPDAWLPSLKNGIGFNYFVGVNGAQKMVNVHYCLSEAPEGGASIRIKLFGFVLSAKKLHLFIKLFLMYFQDHSFLTETIWNINKRKSIVWRIEVDRFHSTHIL